MKFKYERPITVFVEYAASDIITLSATVKSNGDYIEWPGLD